MSKGKQGASRKGPPLPRPVTTALAVLALRTALAAAGAALLTRGALPEESLGAVNAVSWALAAFLGAAACSGGKVPEALGGAAAAVAAMALLGMGVWEGPVWSAGNGLAVLAALAGAAAAAALFAPRKGRPAAKRLRRR